MTNPIEDYINKLEGKTDIDPLSVARDLRGLAIEEIGVREAKIEELNSTVAEKDRAIAESAASLSAQKAKNFDLVSQIPSNTSTNVNRQENDDKPSADNIKVADLFSDSVRKRHFKNY